MMFRAFGDFLKLVLAHDDVRVAAGDEIARALSEGEPA